jgi:hypothetical protein
MRSTLCAGGAIKPGQTMKAETFFMRMELVVSLFQEPPGISKITSICEFNPMATRFAGVTHLLSSPSLVHV